MQEDKKNLKRPAYSKNDSLQRPTYLYGFPGCLEPIAVIGAIAAEDNFHFVSPADDGNGLARPTIFLFEGLIRSTIR